jgi:DHA2 family lincomycin resistance protein-like MFS transporter
LNTIALDGEPAVTAHRNRRVINLLLISSFVVILNWTIMSVAIPPLMLSLGVAAAAAIAPSLEFLVAARVVQASGTAIMLPLLMRTIMTVVPPETRGKAMGDVMMVISVAPAVGPVLSGLVLDNLNWRLLFLVVLTVFAFGGTVYGISLLGVQPVPGQLPSWIPLVVGIVGMIAFVLRQPSFCRSISRTCWVSARWPRASCSARARC